MPKTLIDGWNIYTEGVAKKKKKIHDSHLKKHSVERTNKMESNCSKTVRMHYHPLNFREKKKQYV